MRRPGLNKNEGIRIKIEQRYFLEDRFSKQSKRKVCKEDQQREKEINLYSILYVKVCFHLCGDQFTCKALSQLLLTLKTHLPRWALYRRY